MTNNDGPTNARYIIDGQLGQKWKKIEYIDYSVTGGTGERLLIPRGAVQRNLSNNTFGHTEMA